MNFLTDGISHTIFEIFYFYMLSPAIFFTQRQRLNSSQIVLCYNKFWQHLNSVSVLSTHRSFGSKVRIFMLQPAILFPTGVSSRRVLQSSLPDRSTLGYYPHLLTGIIHRQEKNVKTNQKPYINKVMHGKSQSRRVRVKRLLLKGY